MSQIAITGASENNLKNVDLSVPRNKIICFVGVSGSGKSTIAFDIIAHEGQRQYFESLSSMSRRYLSKSNRPKVDTISGISSTIIINQSRLHPSPRSTVGTVTEIYTYLRLLFSRAGFPIFDSSAFSFNHPHGACQKCKGLGRALDIDQSKLINIHKSLNDGAILYNNWRVGSMYWKIIRSTKFFDMDKIVKDYTSDELNKLIYAPKQKVNNNDNGVVMPMYQGIVTHLNSRGTSVHRHTSDSEMKYFNFINCPDCHGGRLKKESLEVKINGKNIGQVANMPITDTINFVKNIDHKNAIVIKPRLLEQLQFLIDAGIGYLSLNRSTDTLSGGEAQRVKLARQLGCDLIETIYVLDEPTAGLHPRDVDTVIKNLKHLRDSGNTVLVVEHDESVMRTADYIVEVGPAGGKNGGQIVFSGDQKSFQKANTLTSTFLSNNNNIFNRKNRKINNYLKVVNASRNNLKNIDVDIPLNVLVSLTGVSGSGKSSLVDEIVVQHGDKVSLVGQGSIGNNRRGCIATYVGIFDDIRSIFALANHVNSSLFSFNSKTGSCPQCHGMGYLNMDMNFLGDVKINCDQCQGKRYQDKILNYKYMEKNIFEILDMTAVEAINFFEDKNIKNGLQMLLDVGLDYISLGQTLDTLSGGEGQRLKLASRLQNKGDIIILDEPTSGLHFADIEKLLALLSKLVDAGNTVIVIEHNLDVIRQSDWIIDLGPEGGEQGGQIIAQGTVADIKSRLNSWTGKYL
ncbi:MAG: excinuclease ABC subunit UvrA [Candidatus Shapirobacteria bacterium]